MIPARNRLRRLGTASRRAAGAAVLLLAGFLVLDALFPFPMETLSRPPATLVTDRAGVPLRAFLPADQTWRIPVRHGEIPAELAEAVILSEDRRFRWHPGVDPLAVIRAAWTNIRAGRVVSGGSTIPMQIARMAEPKPRRIAGKIQEAFRALQLRWHLPPQRLLEVYFNLAPYGGNLEGVGAASWFWFGKQVDRLSLGEIALLASLPRSPNRLDPARHPEAARAARDAQLARLREGGVISDRQAADAAREPLPRARRAAPMESPHLARHLAETMPGEPRIRSAIDLRLQRAAEAVVARRILELRAQGVGNAAAVVIENETRALRAMVGSAGFLDAAHEGQVNGALATRSPGSALKPFLYAMAFDEGEAVPESWLLDVPIDFSGYVAQNYDDRYRGLVTAREALRESLNAPAVWLLSRVGLARFLDKLRDGGLATLDRPAPFYGLPLVLGGGEVRLLDLTNLFATLARGGVHRPVALVDPGAGEAGRSAAKRLFSSESAALVLEILMDVERPDLPDSWRLAREAPAVAWKTGTSYGHRDAWAIGTTGRFTAGVWIGNFDGTPVKGISGARQAGPVLFDLIRAVERAPSPLAAAGSARLDVAETDLCAVSHERPGPFCGRRIRATTIASRSRIPICTYHRRVFVDVETGELLDGSCLAGREARPRVVESYPEELVAWWRSQGIPIPADLRSSAACAGPGSSGAPEILTPDPSTPYRLRRGAPPEFQKLPLLARLPAGADAAAERLYWYEDGRLVASGKAAAPLYITLNPGRHRLVVVDSSGRSGAVTYLVED